MCDASPDPDGRAPGSRPTPPRDPPPHAPETPEPARRPSDRPAAPPTAPVLRPVVHPLARQARRASLTPATLNRIGVALAGLAAVWFTDDGPRGALAGSLLLALVLLTDAVARELDRERRDVLEAWLAVLLARLREYAVYAGLAVGGTLGGVPDAWAWAAGALVALALRDAVLEAARARPATGASRAAPDGPRQRRPESPIRTFDPSATTAATGTGPGDASLTAELLGGMGDVGGRPGSGRHGDPIRIRTTPRRGGVRSVAERDRQRWREGRERARRRVTGGRAGPGGGTVPASPAPRGPRLAPLHRLTGFGQGVRFAVVAGTITIWDARVTFIALIVGCAVACVGELAERPARQRDAVG